MTKASYALPTRQRETLDYIKAHIEKHEQSPTFEEIADAIGSNKQNVRYFVEILEEKGFISRDKFKHRSITVL